MADSFYESRRGFAVCAGFEWGPTNMSCFAMLVLAVGEEIKENIFLHLVDSG